MAAQQKEAQREKVQILVTNSSNVVEGYQNQICTHITAGVHTKILSKGEKVHILWSYCH